MKKIMLVFGTRPEAIKLAPVYRELKKKNNLEVIVCVTGQHREMLDQVLKLFGIVPDIDLNLMKPGQNLSELTARVLNKMQEVFAEIKPDKVIVQGDTTTVMASAMAAFYNNIAIAHVEAGLRTGDIYAPWPEEFNRRVASVITENHFAPTIWAKENLLNEKINSDKILVTGNTVIDALLEVSAMISGDESIRDDLAGTFSWIDKNKKTILVTGHRRENFGSGFLNICEGLAELANDCQLQIIYPVHLNPNVQKPVNSILGSLDNVHLIPPQDYLPFIYLMNSADLIITDSGGVQEEAPALGKPVLVMREITERPEAVKAGVVKLVGTDKGKIVTEARKLLSDKKYYLSMSRSVNPYGDGRAAERIAASLAGEVCDEFCFKG